MLVCSYGHVCICTYTVVALSGTSTNLMHGRTEEARSHMHPSLAVADSRSVDILQKYSINIFHRLKETGAETQIHTHAKYFCFYTHALAFYLSMYVQRLCFETVYTEYFAVYLQADTYVTRTKTQKQPVTSIVVCKNSCG